MRAATIRRNDSARSSGGEDGLVNTVTFEEKCGKTLLAMHELYPSNEALDAAGTGAPDGMGRIVRATG
jgi:hypothetical protein